MKKLSALPVLLTVLFLVSGCSVGSSGGDDYVDEAVVDIPGKWTVMVWLDGDNNLETAAVNDLNEMEYGLYKAIQANSSVGSDVSVIVQIDRISGYLSGGYDGGSDWTDTRRYKISPDSDTDDALIRSERLDESSPLGEVNMGDASELQSFISYCKTNYPSDNYALILWNHGGGVRGSERSNFISSDYSNTPKAVCWDDTDGEDCLYIGEITDTLTDSEDIDLIGFDACLMGMAEVAYEYRPGNGDFSADYMAASPASEQGDGWEYDALFSCFTAGAEDGITNPAELFAKAVVAEYKRAFYYYSGEAMSAYDLSKIEDVKTALDNLASLISGYKSTVENIRGNAPSVNMMEYFNQYYDYEWINNPHFDLYDFAEKVSDNSTISSAARSAADTLKISVDSCLVKSWGNSSYSGHSNGINGLGFFFPDGDEIYDSYPHYAYQWWYTEEDTNSWSAGNYYGNLDFCNSDGDGTVEGWRELLEFWFDNGTSYTPSSH